MNDVTDILWSDKLLQFVAADIMTARNKVEFINLEWSESKVKRVILAMTHYTLPVIQGSDDNFVGVIKIDELSKAISRSKKPWSDLQKYCHAAEGLFMTDAVDKVYKKLLKSPTGLINVVDQRRNFIGVITLKDIYGLLNPKKYRIAKSRMVNRKYGRDRFKWAKHTSLQKTANLRNSKNALI